MKRIAAIILLLLASLALVSCDDKEITTGIYTGYCWNSWTGEHYWCGD